MYYEHLCNLFIWRKFANAKAWIWGTTSCSYCSQLRNWDSSVLGGVANSQATMATPTFLERWRQYRTSSKFVPYQVLFSAVHKAIDILFARSITRKVLQPFVKHASLVLLGPIIADCGAELWLWYFVVLKKKLVRTSFRVNFVPDAYFFDLQPRKVFVQPNTVIVNGEAELKDYPLTAAGLIQSYVERNIWATDMVRVYNSRNLGLHDGYWSKMYISTSAANISDLRIHKYGKWSAYDSK